MKKIICVSVILAMITYLGQRMIDIMLEPTLPTDDGLYKLQLKFNDVDYVCSTTMPKDCILACAAGFSKGWNLLQPAEERIENSYVSKGVFHERQTSKKMGTFTYYNHQFHFTIGNAEAELKKAAEHGGMGFQQFRVIGNYCKRYQSPYSKPYHYRVLAEIKSELYFIEAAEPMNYDAFVERLLRLKVKNALYLDTGEGWETYCLNLNGRSAVLRKTWYPFPFRTNFIVFK